MYYTILCIYDCKPLVPHFLLHEWCHLGFTNWPAWLGEVVYCQVVGHTRIFVKLQ